MNLKPFVCLCIIFLCITSCIKEKEHVDTIFMSCDYGDGINYLIMGLDAVSVAHTYNNDKDLKESISIFGASEYVLPPEALDYLSKYIIEKCRDEIDSTNESRTLFTINIHLDNKNKKCYQYGREQVHVYFQGMIDYIKQSKYAADFSQVLPHLEIIVANRKDYGHGITM